MANKNEPAKLLLPYLQRADDLQKHGSLVAYYCQLFAMAKGLKMPNIERTKTTISLLVSLVNQLEKVRNLGKPELQQQQQKQQQHRQQQQKQQQQHQHQQQ